MFRVRRWWPLLGAILAGACGSSSHSSTTVGLPSDPTRAVKRALAALSQRAFDESFTQVGRLHVTGVAPAKAAALNARLRGAGSNETGLVEFKDVHDFQAKITTSDSGTQYIRASGGSFGPRTVNGTAVEEYTGIFPGSAIKSAYGSLVQLPPGSTFGRGAMTIDISRAAGVPVHIFDVISLSTDLAALQPDLRGRVITVVTSTRAFAHFGPPR